MWYRIRNKKGVKHIARLAQIRKAKGLSQAQLSKLSGVSRIAIARYETGKCSPTLQTLEKLSVALGVPIGELVDEQAG